MLALALAPALLPTTSCIKGDHEDYENWREKNDTYLAEINLLEYEQVIPDWAPRNCVYMKWHNNRSLTAGNLVPMSTSTVNFKYELEDIEGTKIENSYGVARGDSVYQSQVNNMIIGMCITLTNMHVGDSVTAIIPYNSGYGAEVKTNMKPYTNLIYHMKLKSIEAFEKPNS